MRPASEPGGPVIRETTKRLLPVALLLLLVPAEARSQVHWESPFHMGPGLTDGLGVHLLDSDLGESVGLLVTWRRGSVPGGVGLRMGLAEGFGDELTGFGGVDVSGLLLGATDDFPLDLVWAGGAGAAIGDYALVSFPLGLFVGRSFTDAGIRFSPYGGLRLNLDAHLGSDGGGPGPGRDDEGLDLALSLDLGGDIVFGDDVAIRFGAAVGDHEALSIGVVLPTVR